MHNKHRLYRRGCFTTSSCRTNTNV